MAQARILVMHSIGVCVDSKGGEIGVLPAVFVHIAPHDQGVQSDKRDAHIHFVIGIRGGGEGSRDFVRVTVGHFFHADHDGRFKFAGGHRHQTGTEGSRAGGAGCLHLGGIPTAQPGPIRHQRAEGALPVDDARHHVADEEPFGALPPGIVHGGNDRIRGDVADRFFPLFVNDGLADT